MVTTVAALPQVLSRYSFTGHRDYACTGNGCRHLPARPPAGRYRPQRCHANCLSCATTGEACEGDASQARGGAHVRGGAASTHLAQGDGWLLPRWAPGTFLMAIMFTIIFLVDRVKACTGQDPRTWDSCPLQPRHSPPLPHSGRPASPGM